MNYLTNYYKNLSEQLEAKCNQLINEIQTKKMLAEAWTPPPTAFNFYLLRNWYPGKPLPEGWTQEQVQNFQRWWKSIDQGERDRFIDDWQRSAPDIYYREGWRWNGPIPIPPGRPQTYTPTMPWPEENGPAQEYWDNHNWQYEPGVLPSIILPGKR